VWVTHHGPVIAGDPETGPALAFRYTATAGTVAWPDVLCSMLRAKNADELIEAMRNWVDPVNNFLFADVHGNIGYQCRGQIPIRSMANAWLPVPGWTGEHERNGHIPFDELPRSVNPEQGYIATANNRPVAEDYPYHISVDFAPGFRVQRVTEGLLSLERPTAEQMSKVHAQRVSIPAETYLKYMNRVEPQDELSARAKDKLLAWSGVMDADRVEPAIYSAFRDALLQEVLEHNLGSELAEFAQNPGNRGLGSFTNRLKARLVTLIREDDSSLLAPGDDWPSLMRRALERGVAALQKHMGGDLEQWRWDRVHQARPVHTLSAAFPELADMLDPPPIPMSGDGDTPLAGGYSPADFATVTGLSVARYAFDLGDWSSSLWAVPLGASGHPGSPHYHDQSETWRKVQMVPMEYDWGTILDRSATQQRLEPA